MTSDDRMTWRLIFNVLDMLERHGYHRYDSRHTGQAMGMIRDLAGVYEGTRNAPYSAGLHDAPWTPRVEPELSGPEADDAVILIGADIGTVTAALEIAADYKRDRAELCADCTDQSCPTCQSRHRDAQSYDRLTDQIFQASQTRPASHDQPEPGAPGPSPGPADPAPGIEAGR